MIMKIISRRNVISPTIKVFIKTRRIFFKKKDDNKKMQSPFFHIPYSYKRDKLQANYKAIKGRIELAYFLYFGRKSINKTQQYHYPADNANNTYNAGTFCFYAYHLILICGSNSFYRVKLEAVYAGINPDISPMKADKESPSNRLEKVSMNSIPNESPTTNVRI